MVGGRGAGGGAGGGGGRGWLAAAGGGEGKGKPKAKSDRARFEQGKTFQAGMKRCTQRRRRRRGDISGEGLTGGNKKGRGAPRVFPVARPGVWLSAAPA